MLYLRSSPEVCLKLSHTLLVSLYSTIAISVEDGIYRFDEFETCHLLRIVA